MRRVQNNGADTVHVSGHLQVKGAARQRKYFAHFVDRRGVKRTRTLGPAHVKDSGRRTPRGAVVWRAGDGACPPGHLTPQAANDALAAILEAELSQPPELSPLSHVARSPRSLTATSPEPVLTFGDAVEQWLDYLRIEKRRKASTVQDARNTARAHLLPRFGADTPLYVVDRRETLVLREGRQVLEDYVERRDTISTEDVDAFRRDLLRSHLSPRSVQKILVLLHGIFKLAKRRGLIATNPSEDAERVTLDDPETFNVLEPIEFEAVYRAVLGELDEREPDPDREADEIDGLSTDERVMFGAMLSTGFYAGPRMGEMRDLPWRNVDFARAMIRIESGYTHGGRSTPKGKRARSTPLVPVLAERLAALGTRRDFSGANDYVFCNGFGERVSDAAVRAVFYAALERAGMGDRRAPVDQHGNPRRPLVVHDLRHSWCTWAVNVWPITKVQSYAGHRDIKTTMRYVHHQTKAEDADLGGAYLARVLGAGDPLGV
jgi:integrase